MEVKYNAHKEKGRLIMLCSTKKFFKDNQEALPVLAHIALFVTPACMTFSSYALVEFDAIATVCLFVGWFLSIFRKVTPSLLCLIILWVVGYYTTIKDGNDYGYTIGTIMLITNLPYWLFAKYGFRKFLNESKNKKG